MQTLRFYTAGNQNILIRIRYNSLSCGACYKKLKKLTQESNAVFQKQGYISALSSFFEKVLLF